MKRNSLIRAAVWAAALLLLFVLSPALNAGEIYEKVLRIHVIANSDSGEDQALKLLVRDRILTLAEERLAGMNAEDAAALIRAGKAEWQREAEAALREAGCGMPVTVELGKEVYPTRTYEGLSLPAGTYESLRIKIGEAEGKNWWCMLFPPVCLNSARPDDALTGAGLSEESVKTVKREGEKYEFRFRFLERIAALQEKLKELFS